MTPFAMSNINGDNAPINPALRTTLELLYSLESNQDPQQTCF